MLSNISFQANYIKPAVVQRRDENDNFHPYKVSVVELDANSANDIKSLYEVDELWSGHSFAWEIYNDFKAVADYENNKKLHFFAITEQKRNFGKLNPADVMCLAEFEEHPNINEINYLQTNPEYGYENYYQPFKHTGSAMIDFLEQHFYDKPIKVFSTLTAVTFYQKNSFTKMPAADDRYFWNA